MRKHVFLGKDKGREARREGRDSLMKIHTVNVIHETEKCPNYNLR